MNPYTGLPEQGAYQLTSSDIDTYRLDLTSSTVRKTTSEPTRVTLVWYLS